MFRPRFWATLGLVLLGASWLSSNHYRPWVNFQAELLAFTGLALLFAGSLAKGHAQKWPASASWIAALMLIPCVQLATGILVFAGDAWLSVIYLSALGSAVALGFSWAQKPDRAPVRLAWLLVLCVPASLSALVGILQWAQLSEVLGIYGSHVDVGDRPMGNMAQPNQLATLLLMGVCALLFLADAWKLSFALTVTLLILSTAVFAFTQSRTGLLAATVMASYLAAKLAASPARNLRIRPWHPLAWLALVWGLSIAVPLFNDALLNGGNRNVGLTDSNSRDRMWLQMFYAIFQSPWWGYGWNQSPAAHRIGALPFPGELTFSNAHSVVLDLLAWVGIPLGLLLLIAVVYWMASRLARAHNWEVVIAMTAIIPFFIHSLLEFPFAYSYFLIPVGLLVGWVDGHFASRSRRASTRVLAACAAAWIVAGCVVTWEYFLVEDDFRVVRFENNRIGNTPTDYRPPEIHVLTHMGSMLRVARMRPHRGMTQPELELLRRVATRFPYGALGYRYAVALGMNGDAEGASREFAVMRGMYGERYYRAIVMEMRELQQDGHPELAQVKT